MVKEDYTGLFDEQIDVITHEKGNILVSASAGSGKTFVMIKRLIRLIVEGKASIREILAITFTDAAAKEMKEKLAAGIDMAIENGNEELGDKAADLPYADVCTIDSFCARIIRLYFYKAGVAPDFSVADAAATDKLKNDAINKTFREFYKSGDEDFKLLAARFSLKRKDDLLKNVILSCYDYISTEENPDKYKENNLAFYTEEGFERIKKEYLNIAKNRLSCLKSELIDLKARLFSAGLNKGAGKADDLIGAIESMLSCSSPYELKNIEIKLRSFDSNPDEYGKELKKETEIYKLKVEEIAAQAARFFNDEEIDKKNIPELYNSTSTIYRIIERFSEIYRAEKTDENVLDFTDLERLALKVLKDDAVSSEMKGKYKYIFVDEYQDVNGVQEAIINSVAKDNVFMVGDVKQSIYGFRGCRSDFFRDKFSEMERRGESAKRLNRNFRSSDAVINAANAVFSYAMVKDVYGANYSGEELKPGGGFPENSGRFKVYRYFPDNIKEEVKTDTALKLYDVLEGSKNLNSDEKEISKEARLIAKIIADELKNTYYDVKSKEYKRVRFSDIAILSRTGAEYSFDLIDGLIKLGVPITTDGDVSVLSYPEVFTLISLLKVLCNFYDDVSLATVMKSPFGNFTDEELTEIALSYYEKSGQGVKATFSEAVAAAKDLPESLQFKTDKFKSRIENARFLSDFLPVGEILERLINENDYYAFLAADENGNDKTERVKFFVSKAFSFNGYSLREFIDLTSTAENAFRTGGGSGGDAVKFATIHSSKGLEYPVVILRGAEKTFDSPQDLDDKVLKDREFGFAVKHYDDELMTVEETPYTGLIKSKIKSDAVSEEMRLFYVAMTRARHALYITFKGKEEENTKGVSFAGLKGKRAVAKSYVNFLPDCMEITDAEETELILNSSAVKRREVIFPTADNTSKEYLKKELSFSYPYGADSSLPLKVSVSAAMKGEEEYFAKNFEFSDDETDAERGNTAHKIMEYYDFENFPDVEEFAEELVKRSILTAEEVEKVDLGKLRRVINGGAFDVVKGKNLLREKNFIVSVKGSMVSDTDTSAPVVLQGKIDLLAIDDDGAYVIDYKYSAHGENTLKKRYSKQLELYAYAVEKSLNVKVKGKYIISLLTGETVKIG